MEFSRVKKCSFLVPEETGSGVYKIAEKVINDVARVTGMQPGIKTTWDTEEQAVLVLTAGCGSAEQELLNRYPDMSLVSGRRESYGFYLLEKPVEGIEEALVIYGSDKLGTIYGLFHLSELLGVTPFVFWGDSVPAVYDRVILSCENQWEEADARQILVENGVSREPSVKYRGFFINDEWPCFGNWTFSHYEGFTAQMYDHVFEYLLRMKGNYLWPAMWTSSFMLDGPDMASMELADEYGIYIGMSHHEPCMRSSEEWDIFRGEDTPYGNEWSYISNKEGLLNYWEDGLKRSKGHNVFPTIGMRGERDSKLLGDDVDVSENVRLLKGVLKEQRRLIREQLESDGEQVPKLFAVYKEVEDYYFGDGESEGLRDYEELDDVTLLLCEDNFSNMRALPQEFERDRKGGFGMYYHLDYHGEPISHEWVSSTPLTKIWEQMTQAYEYGIRDLWIVNVGDLKFQEYPLSYFMELAYDFEAWGSKAPDMTREYTRRWVEQEFHSNVNAEEKQQIQEVLDGYIGLNSLRRPEALNDTIYHPAHHLEGRKLLEECERLEQMNEKLLEKLKERGQEAGYYSMIYYPAAASFNLLKMHLYSGFNHLYAAQGKAIANEMGDKMEACILRDQTLAQEFADWKYKKWAGMEMAFHIGFTNWNDEDWRYPVRHVVRLPKAPRLVVSRADAVKHFTNQYFPKPLMISDFMESQREQVILQIANGGQGSIQWKIDHTDCKWLSFSSCEGETSGQQELTVKVLRENLPLEEMQEFHFKIVCGEQFVPVCVQAKKRDFSQVPKGTYIMENNRYVIPASGFKSLAAGQYQEESAQFSVLNDYGKHGSGVKVFPVTSSFSGLEHAPGVTYNLWAEEAGEFRLRLHTSPANPLIFKGELHFGVSIANEEQQWSRILTVTDKDYKGGEPGCAAWENAVLDQEHICETQAVLAKGLNTLTVYGQEAGIVLEKITLYKEDTQIEESYLGPENTMMTAED